MFDDDLDKRTMSMINAVEFWLGNPLSKRVLRLFTKKCSCGRRIELALKCYTGQSNSKDLCLGCRTAARAVKSIMDYFIEKSEIDKNDVMNYLKDPVWRKGLSSVLEGIAMYGPKKPFVGKAPFLVVWNISKACNLNCKHCLDYETLLMIEMNGEIRIRKIGEVVDELMKLGTNICIKDGYEIAELPENMSVRAYAMDDKKGKTLLRRVTRVMRKKTNNKKIIEIKACGGIALKLTTDHLVFTKDGWKEAGGLVENDYLTIPYFLTPPENIEKIDIITKLIDEPNLRVSGLNKIFDEESRKQGMLRNEFSEMVFANLPKSTREGWVYGYTSVPMSLTRRFVEKNACLDNLMISSIGSQEKEIPALFEIRPSLASFFGYFVSDGHFTKATHRLTVTNTNNDVLASVKKSFSCLGYSSYIEFHGKSGRAPQIYAASYLLHLLFEKVFGLKDKAKNKIVPMYFFNSKKEIIKEFLAACFAGDGSISNWDSKDTHKNRNISYSSVSPELVNGISALLWQLGVPNTVQRYSYRNYIIIPPQFHQEFLENVGFSTKEKNDRLKIAAEFSKTCKNFSRWVVDKENNRIFAPIISIKPTTATTEYVYDLGIETFHEEGNFVIGFPPVKVHNCYENAHTAGPDELTLQQKLKAVDMIADSGIAYVAISGGEPLMLSGFEDVVKRIKENEMGFSIATNGTLLTKEKAEMLKKYNCLFAQISLDGADAKTHNSFRGANAFQRTIKGIKNAVAAGLDVGISTTVTKYNYNQVGKLINLAEKLGVYLFIHYNFIPTGRGKDIVKMDITPQQREELLKMLAKKSEKSRVKLLTTAPQYARVCTQINCGMPTTHFDTLSTEKDGNKIKFLADFIGGCGAARLYCALEPNGGIEPCVFIPINLGNIMKDNFTDIWHKHPDLIKIRDRDKFKGNCGKCEYKTVCGGCRARAYGYYKDLSASDPGCINNLREWNKLNIEMDKPN
ncbi:MAG: radical SAM protein [Candidatus Aenigmarchaeota archaeon]|nr:radical SAM protein [Candidatus Aenigmarchaeota archaeon]